MKKYRVTINKRGRIPGVGVGPFRRPLYITETVYNHLTRLGYPIEVISTTDDNKVVKESDESVKIIPDNKIKESTVVKQQPVIPKEEPKKEAEVELVSDSEISVPDEEEVIAEEVVDNNDTEIVEDEVTSEVEETSDEEEIVVNDKDLIADSYYTEEFLTSKNVCKKILDNRQVQYDSNASYKKLKELVSESNPEVEIDEE
jgi:hypothetical protein